MMVTELIQQVRIRLLSSQANDNVTSITSYDTIANELVKFAELSNQHTIEIQRLQELLRKNNIQFTLPVEPVKLPENLAVIPEPELITPETTNL